MIEKCILKIKGGKNSRQITAGIASFILLAIVVGICINYNFFSSRNRIASWLNNGSTLDDSDGRVCEMFVSDGSMYYTDFKDNLYRYNSSAKTGQSVSTIEIAKASEVFEDNGYIYYSNGSAIFQHDIAENTSVMLVSGKNIGVNAVRNGILLYTIAYKDDASGCFKEFEYHMYKMTSQKDTVLWARSADFWQILDFNGDIAIADANLKNDSGLFAFNIATRTPKKLLSLRVHEGSIINGRFYYTSHDEKGLWCIGLNGDGKEQIPLPDTNDQSAFVDRITGWGDNLYIAVYFNGENNILQINLQTHQYTKLADGLGRVWRLCTDGKTLYAYDTKSPSDKTGNITEIPL